MFRPRCYVCAVAGAKVNKGPSLPRPIIVDLFLLCSDLIWFVEVAERSHTIAVTVLLSTAVAFSNHPNRRTDDDRGDFGSPSLPR